MQSAKGFQLKKLRNGCHQILPTVSDFLLPKKIPTFKKNYFSMKKHLFPFLLLFIISRAFSQTPQLVLQQFSTGYSSPVDIENCGDSRLFIVQQTGYIYLCDSAGNKNPTAFLDV